MAMLSSVYYLQVQGRPPALQDGEVWPDTGALPECLHTDGHSPGQVPGSLPPPGLLLLDLQALQDHGMDCLGFRFGLLHSSGTYIK